MAKLEADVALLQEATAPPRGSQPGANHTESASKRLSANRYYILPLATGDHHPLCVH